MRAFYLTDYCGPEGLRLVDVPEPKPRADHALLRVEAIGVNFPDLLMTQGQYQVRPELPFVPGCEVAGTVISAPSDCGFREGDRAAAFIWQGGYAEKVLVPPGSMARVEPSVDLVTAAGTMVNHQTVHFALKHRGQMQAGESVLVMGAGGGIGTAAVQVARGLGGQVIAGVADDSQIPTAREAGAERVVVLGPGFSEAVLAANEGAPVDVVVDPLGGWLFNEAIRCLGPGGRILVLGFAAGEIPVIKVNRLLLRNVSVIGVAFGAYLDVDPSLVAHQAASLNRMAQEGFVQTHSGEVIEFDDLPDALSRLGRGLIRGKAVVRMAEPRQAQT